MALAVRTHVKLNCHMIMVNAVTDILQIFPFLFIVFHVVCIIIYTLHCILTFIIPPLNFFVWSASRKHEPVGRKKHLNNFGKIYLLQHVGTYIKLLLHAVIIEIKALS